MLDGLCFFDYETAPHQSVSRTASPQGEAYITKAEILNLCDLQQSVMERAMPAPGGKAWKKAKINFWTIVLQSVMERAMPAPGGSLFHRHKIKFQMIVFQSVTKRAMPAPGGSLGRRKVGEKSKK